MKSDIEHVPVLNIRWLGFMHGHSLLPYRQKRIVEALQNQLVRRGGKPLGPEQRNLLAHDGVQLIGGGGVTIPPKPSNPKTTQVKKHEKSMPESKTIVEREGENRGMWLRNIHQVDACDGCSAAMRRRLR
jgi:hypothetical protein